MPYLFTTIAEIRKKETKWMIGIYVVLFSIVLWAGLAQGWPIQNSVGLGLLVLVYIIPIHAFGLWFSTIFMLRCVIAASIRIGMPVSITRARRHYHISPRPGVQRNLFKQIILETLFLLLGFCGIAIMAGWTLIVFTESSAMFS